MPFVNNLDSFDDATQAQRPNLAVHLGGAGKTDNPKFPPNVTTMPNAGDWNQMVSLIAALGQVCPVAILFCNGAGAAITSVASARQTPALVSGDFTFVRSSAGIYVITPPATKLPISSFPPMVSQADNTEIDRVRCFLSAGTYNVTTKLGATPTDCNFMLAIY